MGTFFEKGFKGSFLLRQLHVKQSENKKMEGSSNNSYNFRFFGLWVCRITQDTKK